MYAVMMGSLGDDQIRHSPGYGIVVKVVIIEVHTRMVHGRPMMGHG